MAKKILKQQANEPTWEEPKGNNNRRNSQF